MKKLLMLLCACMLIMPCFAQKKKANKDTAAFRYELECAGNAAPGNYLVKVWTFSKSKSVAIEQCKKNAVHGIIFKGFTGSNGCISQRAMAPNPGVEFEFEEYFNLFFQDGGEYYKYVMATPGTQEILKVGNEYKVGVIVSVQKDALRKALEAAGVIKGLGSGF